MFTRINRFLRKPFINPWANPHSPSPRLGELAKRFFSKSLREKYAAVSRRLQYLFPSLLIPVRLPFGAWWLARKDHVGQPILYNRFETAEVSFVERLLQPEMTVLDIGAHHGFYTLLAAKRVGSGGTVIAFEPSARERRVLRIHCTLNRCRNVRILPLALGAENGSSDLYVVEKWAAGCNSLRPPAADVRANTTREQVRVARLDDQLALLKIDHVDFMKLDVEGGELAVLQGAQQLLARRPRPVILAEVQDVRTQPWGYRAREIIDYLRERGYQWFHISPEGFLEELDVTGNTYDENFVACPEERAASLRRVKNPPSPNPNRAAEEKNSGS